MFAVIDIRALREQANFVQLPAATPIPRPRRILTAEQKANGVVTRRAREVIRQQDGGFPYDDRLLIS